ncbi:NAD-dependent epimerase/dehydratase family protein [Bacillus sp. NTK071]|uniref:NAD-dependent epimerase/dehydratase family protein n=1 Tax=Bacillus sp. NTK071 TaxID=2802175 RepID=UPI001A8D38E6|nr:NAD-dependent epimerase/dehydratase family protein [Bacillus sp. NTK071]MBN8207263.1 NAD-dependent epimerase/dehydratase family protein [Bacillus sp. NTK071]
MKNAPTILITGASGFTGQHACQHFVQKGFHVIAVVRTHHFNLTRVKVCKCNVIDKCEVTALISKEQPDFVLHLAGLNSVAASWADPDQSIEANVLSTLYLLEAIRKESPNTRIVVAGSALQHDFIQDGHPPHPYSLSKSMQMIIAESWASLYQLNVIMAKPSNLIGPGNSNGVCSVIARKIVQMEENQQMAGKLYLNDLSIQRDFLDVRDVITAYDLLLHSGEIGKVYEIGSGNSHSLEEIVTHMKNLTKINITVEAKENRNNENKVKMTIKDIKALGWTSTRSLHSSLSDTLNYYRNRPLEQ